MKLGNPTHKVELLKARQDGKRTCVVCKVSRDFVFSHTRDFSGINVYKDERGRLWNGRHCADCVNHSKKVPSKNRYAKNFRGEK